MYKKQAELDLRGMMLVALVCAWIAGIVIASWLTLPAIPLLFCAAGAFLGAIFLWSDQNFRLILLIALFLCLGAWRFTSTTSINDPHTIARFINSKAVEVQGTVSDEPKLAGRTFQLQIDVSKVSLDAGATWQEAHGHITAHVMDRSQTLQDRYGATYGDSVVLQGKLSPQTPGSAPDVVASMLFPRVSVKSSGGNPLISFIYTLRIRLAILLTQSLPQPEAALLLAIFLGLL